MGKYIVEVKDGETLYKAVITPDGEPYITPAMGNVYTEPDLEQVRKEAYDKGFDDGKNECPSVDADDAWDAARKIFLPVAQGGLPANALIQIFGNRATEYIFKDYSAPEAIEKIRQYEQRQEEIQVGDEVIRHYKSEFMEGDDAPSIFLSEKDGCFRCLAFNGRSIMIAEYPKNQYRKTGRHFPEIAEVLQKMKES